MSNIGKDISVLVERQTEITKNIEKYENAINQEKQQLVALTQKIVAMVNGNCANLGGNVGKSLVTKIVTNGGRKHTVHTPRKSNVHEMVNRVAAFLKSQNEPCSSGKIRDALDIGIKEWAKILAELHHCKTVIVDTSEARHFLYSAR